MRRRNFIAVPPTQPIPSQPVPPTQVIPIQPVQTTQPTQVVPSQPVPPSQPILPTQVVPTQVVPPTQVQPVPSQVVQPVPTQVVPPVQPIAPEEPEEEDENDEDEDEDEDEEDEAVKALHKELGVEEEEEEEEEEDESSEDYGAMNVAELKQEVKNRGIKGYSKLKWQELVDLLEKDDRENPAPAQPAQAQAQPAQAQPTQTVAPTQPVPQPETKAPARRRNPPASSTDYKKMLVPELKKLFTARGLKPTGTKKISQFRKDDYVTALEEADKKAGVAPVQAPVAQAPAPVSQAPAQGINVGLNLQPIGEIAPAPVSGNLQPIGIVQAQSPESKKTPESVLAGIPSGNYVSSDLNISGLGVKRLEAFARQHNLPLTQKPRAPEIKGAIIKAFPPTKRSTAGRHKKPSPVATQPIASAFVYQPPVVEEKVLPPPPQQKPFEAVPVPNSELYNRPRSPGPRVQPGPNLPVAPSPRGTRPTFKAPPIIPSEKKS